MGKLSVHAQSRDNNFQLIRFGAATGVFISHCFPLAGFGATGKPALLGYISLNVFFIISGFLVTKSFLDREHYADYVGARILRIFPALIIAVLFSTYVIGLLFTSLSTSAFLADMNVHEYAFKNIVLFLPNIPNYLPGVFLNSEYRPIVNAPLWSLPYEVWCYTGLLLMGFLLKAKVNPKWFYLATLLVFIYFFSTFVLNYANDTSKYAFVLGKEAYRLGAMFMLGILLYAFRDKIKISHLFAILIVVLIVASIFIDRTLSVALAYGGLGYLVLYLAYGIGGLFRLFNRVGDYSYGVYIFGYPIQQATEQVAPNLSLPMFFVVSFSITLLLAVASWHLVEKRALTFKR
jgi:peptidoglycan/LPS O-acetylase OafA/YrhL